MPECHSVLQNVCVEDDDLRSLEWLQTYDIRRITKLLPSNTADSQIKDEGTFDFGSAHIPFPPENARRYPSMRITGKNSLTVSDDDIKAAATMLLLKQRIAVGNSQAGSAGQLAKKTKLDEKLFRATKPSRRTCRQKRRVLPHTIEDHRYVSENSKFFHPRRENCRSVVDAAVQVSSLDFPQTDSDK